MRSDQTNARSGNALVFLSDEWWNAADSATPRRGLPSPTARSLRCSVQVFADRDYETGLGGVLLTIGRRNARWHRIRHDMSTSHVTDLNVLVHYEVLWRYLIDGESSAIERGLYDGGVMATGRVEFLRDLVGWRFLHESERFRTNVASRTVQWRAETND